MNGMSRFAGLSSLALILLLAVADPRPALAQRSGSVGDATSADCGLIPGGNAPIDRIARLEDGLSVRNLGLTYFGKPLGDLTADDFRYLEELWPLCGTYSEDVAQAISTNAKRVIDEALAAQASAEDWMRAAEARLSNAPPSPASVAMLHDIWQGLINREFEMSRPRFDKMVAFLSAQQDRLYSAGGGVRGGAALSGGKDSPFYPGPPERRELDE